MDPETITAGALAAQVFATSIQAAASESTHSLIEWVRHRFADSEELTRVEEAADSPSRVSALGLSIQEAAESDQTLYRELQHELTKLKDQEPSAVENAVQSAVGSQNINANHSTVQVTFGTAQPPAVARLRARWLTGDLYELVNVGSATAYGVNFTHHESFMIQLRDEVPADLEEDESLAFMATRFMGTVDERLHVTWTTADGEPKSKKVRVPHRGDK